MLFHQDATSISFSTLYAISFALGVVCNILILALAWRKKVFKDTCQARLLVTHTSFVDLITSFCYLQSSVGVLSPSVLTTKRYICHGLSYFNGIVISEMHHSFLLLSIQRYFIIKKPVHARIIFTSSKTYVYIACTWLFSIGIVVSAELSSSNAVYLPSVGSCMLAPTNAFALVLILLRSLIFIITIVFYTKAYITYRNSQKQVIDMQKCTKVSVKVEATKVYAAEVDCASSVEPDRSLTIRRKRSRSDPAILFRRSGHSPTAANSSAKVRRASSVSEGIGYFRSSFSVVNDGNQRRNSSQECSTKELNQMSSTSELGSTGPNQIVTSSTTIESADARKGQGVSDDKGSKGELTLKPKVEDKRERKSRRVGRFSRLRTANGATKSILIITGYYIVTSLFTFILPNFEVTLPIGLENRIIVIRSISLLNSTNNIINFVVFLTVNKQFRIELLKLFKCRQ